MPSGTVKTMDEYISGFPEEVQAILQKIRTLIRENAPGSQEAMKYGIPTFTLNGNLVHFAAFAHHIGFYPTPSAIVKFKKELSIYKGAKGSVQFPFDRPIPYELMVKIVQFRVREVLAKPKNTAKRK